MTLIFFGDECSFLWRQIYVNAMSEACQIKKIFLDRLICDAIEKKNSSEVL